MMVMANSNSIGKRALRGTVQAVVFSTNGLKEWSKMRIADFSSILQAIVGITLTPR
jgi:hypothetical protein